MKKTALALCLLVISVTSGYSSALGGWSLFLTWNNKSLQNDTIITPKVDTVFIKALINSTGPNPYLPQDFVWTLNGVPVTPPYKGGYENGVYALTQPGLWEFKYGWPSATPYTQIKIFLAWEGTLSVNDITKALNTLEIFPNPSTGIITVSSVETISSIAIVNPAGKTIYSINTNSEKASIDLADKPKGIYFVHANTIKGTAYNKKIIIE